jgi:pimeloyl-ACP methyl ester carboxylesterase
MRENGFWSLGPHGFHWIAYTEWGDAASPRIVICAHGLTRNNRDFDWLARALESNSRVICMDVAGRGRSEWLSHKQDYGFPLYLADAAALIARVTAPRIGSSLSRLLPWSSQGLDQPWVDWVGTSMGGLIGMLLASQPNSPIRRLVLNDVGALVPWAALLRLKGYMGRSTGYQSIGDVEQALRAACSTWGPLSDEQWQHMATHSSLLQDDGSYVLACDPGIANVSQLGLIGGPRMAVNRLLGIDLWQVWDEIRAPTLVLRGAESDVLRADTLREMQQRGPATQTVEFAGIGHAPSLMSEDQIKAVREFL